MHPHKPAAVTLLASLLLAGGALADDPVPYSGRGFAEVNGGRLCYEVRGSGEPLVFVHGCQLDSRMWDDQFEVFARQYRAVRYDVRGYGGSPLTDRPYSHVDDLAALMDYLGIHRAHLIGLSMGGQIAADFAVTHPPRVLSLVLASASVSGLNTATSDDLRRFRQLYATAREKGGDAAARLWLEHPIMAPAAARPRLRSRLRQLALENGRSWLNDWSLLLTPQPPTVRRLEEIRVPTLLILGDLDTPATRAAIDTLAARIPHARKVVIEGAGHMVNMEKPGAFDATVLTFLRGARRMSH